MRIAATSPSPPRNTSSARALVGWRRAHCYVEDVAHAIALTVSDEAAAGRIYNVAYERTFTEIDWVREIARVHGWSGEVVLANSGFLPEALREDAFDLRQDYVIDSSRIRLELGYRETVSEDEALRRTIEWERLNPPEPGSLPPELARHPGPDSGATAVLAQVGLAETVR